MTGNEPRVLYVDESPAFRELVTRALDARPGVTGWAALDGPMALAALEGSRFDCVVSADYLPEMTGLDLLGAVRERDTELPFVLFAAEGDERLAGEALGRGATDYLRRSGTNPVSLLVDRAAGYAEQHRERAALERVRERYELAGRAVSDVIWERSLEDGAVRWGAGVSGTLGYERGGSYDRDWWLDRVHPEDRAAVREAWAPVEAGDEGRFECRYRFRRADGSYAHVVDGGEAVEGDGAPTRLVGALRDVTERLEQAAALERRNERLDEFASVVGHDLRNPLGVARGHLELVREEHNSEHVATVADALERMDTLIDDLLLLAREGEGVDEAEPVPLADHLQRRWDTVTTDGATLTVEAEGVVRADRSRLGQLFENLFRNSVEHSSTGGRPAADDAVEHGTASGRTGSNSGDGDGAEVSVTVGRLPDGFYVADDGPGIPADERDAVFETGYTTGSGGTGLGLSIVRSVAEAHGWTVSVAESADGGARFEVRGVTFVDDGSGAAEPPDDGPPS